MKNAKEYEKKIKKLLGGADKPKAHAKPQDLIQVLLEAILGPDAPVKATAFRRSARRRTASRIGSLPSVRTRTCFCRSAGSSVCFIPLGDAS
jgi:hypothetical protein